MKQFVSLSKKKAKGKCHFEAWEMGTGQHRASEHITDPNPQLWGLWRNLHLSPRPVLGSRAGHIPCPPTPSVSNSPKPRQEGGSTSSPPFSANWCQAQQHKGPLSPSVLPLTLWHLQSASLPGMSAGAAGSCLQPRVNPSVGIIPRKLG